MCILCLGIPSAKQEVQLEDVSREQEQKPSGEQEIPEKKIRKPSEEQKFSRAQGVHQRIPSEKEALYKEKTGGLSLSSSSKAKYAGKGKGDRWTQVNIFDIVDESRKQEQKTTKRSTDDVSKRKPNTNASRETGKARQATPESTSPETSIPLTYIVSDSQSEARPHVLTPSSAPATDTESELFKPPSSKSTSEWSVSPAEKTYVAKTLPEPEKGIQKQTSSGRLSPPVNSTQEAKVSTLKDESDGTTVLKKYREPWKTHDAQDSQAANREVLSANKVETAKDVEHESAGQNELDGQNVVQATDTEESKRRERDDLGNENKEEIIKGQKTDGEMELSQDDTKKQGEKEEREGVKESQQKEKDKYTTEIVEGESVEALDEKGEEDSAKKAHTTEDEQTTGSKTGHEGDEKGEEKTEDKDLTDAKKKHEEKEEDRDKTGSEEKTGDQKEHKGEGKGEERTEYKDTIGAEKMLEGEEKGKETEPDKKRPEEQEKDKEEEEEKKHKGADKELSGEEKDEEGKEEGNRKKKKKKKKKNRDELGGKDEGAGDESGSKKKKKKKKKSGEAEDAKGEQEDENKKREQKRDREISDRQLDRSQSASASSRNNSSSSESPSQISSFKYQQANRLDRVDLLSKRLLSLLYRDRISGDFYYTRTSSENRPSRSPRLRQNAKLQKQSKSERIKTEQADGARKVPDKALSDKSRKGSESRGQTTVKKNKVQFTGSFRSRGLSQSQSSSRKSSRHTNILDPDTVPLSPRRRCKVTFNGLRQESKKERCRRWFEDDTKKPRLSVGLGQEGKGHKNKARYNTVNTEDVRQARNDSQQERDAEMWRRWFEVDTVSGQRSDNTSGIICLGLHGDNASEISGIPCQKATKMESCDRKEKTSRSNSRGREPVCQRISPNICYGMRGDTHPRKISPFLCSYRRRKSLQRYFKQISNEERPHTKSPNIRHICLGLHSTTNIANNAESGTTGIRQDRYKMSQSTGLKSFTVNQHTTQPSLQVKDSKCETLSPRKRKAHTNVDFQDVRLSQLHRHDIFKEDSGPASSQKIPVSGQNTTVLSTRTHADELNKEINACSSEASSDSLKPAPRYKGNLGCLNNSRTFQSAQKRSNHDSEQVSKSGDRNGNKRPRRPEKVSPQQFMKVGHRQDETEATASSNVDNAAPSGDSCVGTKMKQDNKSYKERKTVRKRSKKNGTAGAMAPSTSDRRDGSQLEFPLVRLDKEESGDDVDFSTAFPTLMTGSHSLFPSASEIERFAYSMERTSPTPISELFSQFQKIEQARALQNDWTTDTNSSHREVTPQTMNRPWTNSAQTEGTPDRVQSQTWDLNIELSTFSSSWTSQSQSHYTVGPRTPFSPPEIFETSEAACYEQTTNDARGSGCNPTSSQVLFPSVSSSHSSISVRESRSSTLTDMSGRDERSSRKNRKRSRSYKQDSSALSSESQPSLHSPHVFIK